MTNFRYFTFGMGNFAAAQSWGLTYVHSQSNQRSENPLRGSCLPQKSIWHKSSDFMIYAPRMEYLLGFLYFIVSTSLHILILSKL